ncbi:acid phosphatase, putative [Bodo saltans]|uniref:Acid phosphatase, putative n=1 Tax=Bodo saltans TaxID=75058 RepID=A0A0S4KL32_BODSA|nr:acid phosphatase, putative [Bodo saltans]|eukprot:CUI15293.1 acid phosphatase, putative [Bodo saltans]
MPLSRLVKYLLALLFVIAYTADGLTFGVIGDWAMGGWKSSWFPEIRSALQFNQQCDFLNCNFTLSVGDNVYCGNVLSCLEKSFVQGFTSGGPFFPSVGNHDNVGPQLAYTNKNPRWKFPSTFYTYKMPIDNTGYTVQIFAVNTMDGSLSRGGQHSWLTKELSNSNARWKIIFGHYPNAGSGRHKRVGTSNAIIPIMHHYNAQAFFTGHDHIVEMNNMGGRVLGISGGISRGGMMSRGKGGIFRRFTLTSPGEYNKYPPDWPTHGFMTVDLSPNVMNVNLFEANGGMYYDFSVTHDWIRRAAAMPASLQNQWPHPSIVLQAYKNESMLPPGPGGGVVFLADGRMVPSSYRRPAGSNNSTNAATDKSEGNQEMEEGSQDLEEGGPSTTSDDGSAASTAVIDGKAATNVPSFVKYSVASECAECDYTPVVDRPFTLYISGISVSSLNRIFLTSSALGCDVKEKPQLLPNTDVVTPGNNAVLFNVTGVATNAFVCFSVDKGSSYTRIKRSDSVFEEPDFVINPPVASNTPNVDANLRQLTPQPSTNAPNSVTSPTTSGDHSSFMVLLVALVCVGGGMIGSKYASRVFGDQ